MSRKFVWKVKSLQVVDFGSVKALAMFVEIKNKSLISMKSRRFVCWET